MKQTLLTVFIMLATPALTLAQATSPGASGNPTKLEQEFKNLLQEMADARGALTEKAAAERRIIAERTMADSYVEVLENGDVRTGAQVLAGRTPESAAAAVRTAAETQLTVVIEDVRAQAHGDMAVVTYLQNSRLVFHGEPVVKRARCTQTFIRRDGRWQSVLHTLTVMPGEPRAAKVVTAALDDYVGQYRLSPSVVYTVSREGEKIVWGRGKQEMVPENENTFLFKRRPNNNVDFNVSYRVIFVRDESGRVTHLRMREFPGVEYSAIKIQ